MGQEVLPPSRFIHNPLHRDFSQILLQGSDARVWLFVCLFVCLCFYLVACVLVCWFVCLCIISLAFLFVCLFDWFFVSALVSVYAWILWMADYSPLY